MGFSNKLSSAFTKGGVYLYTSVFSYTLNNFVILDSCCVIYLMLYFGVYVYIVCYFCNSNVRVIIRKMLFIGNVCSFTFVVYFLNFYQLFL